MMTTTTARALFTNLFTTDLPAIKQNPLQQCDNLAVSFPPFCGEGTADLQFDSCQPIHAADGLSFHACGQLSFQGCGGDCFALDGGPVEFCADIGPLSQICAWGGECPANIPMTISFSMEAGNLAIQTCDAGEAPEAESFQFTFSGETDRWGVVQGDLTTGQVRFGSLSCASTGSAPLADAMGFLACNADTDGDGIADAIDDCILVGNPEQGDADGDGLGDACDDSFTVPKNPDEGPETQPETQPSAECPNGACEAGEDCLSCAADCGPCNTGFCGDRICQDATEDCSRCPDDCGPCAPPPEECGNGLCERNEDCRSCPRDCFCPPPPPPGTCGDGICGLDEDCFGCSRDCQCTPPPPNGVCGDGTCDLGEDCFGCSRDCSCGPPPPPR